LVVSSSAYETTTSGVVNVGARVGVGGEEARVAHGVKWRARLVDCCGARVMAERVTSRTLPIMAKSVVGWSKGEDANMRTGSWLLPSSRRSRTSDGQLQLQLRKRPHLRPRTLWPCSHSSTGPRGRRRARPSFLNHFSERALPRPRHVGWSCHCSPLRRSILPRPRELLIAPSVILKLRRVFAVIDSPTSHLLHPRRDPPLLDS
jgi:hypothetical protein